MFVLENTGGYLSNSDDKLPDQTLETLVRSFFKESSGYGFSQLDYVRFVNMLLDLSMEPVASEAESVNESQSIETSDNEAHILNLPIESKRIRIRKFDPDTEKFCSADRFPYTILPKLFSVPVTTIIGGLTRPVS